MALLSNATTKILHKETLKKFRVKFLIRYLRSEIAKNYDFTYLLHAKSRRIEIILVAFFTSAI